MGDDEDKFIESITSQMKNRIISSNAANAGFVRSTNQYVKPHVPLGSTLLVVEIIVDERISSDVADALALRARQGIPLRIRLTEGEATVRLRSVLGS